MSRVHPAPDEPLVELEQVSVCYDGGQPVLQGLSLRLARGERLALLGLNGSGKTTLLLALAGLVPHRGQARIGGIRLTRENMARVRSMTGFLFSVPEDQILFPRVEDDVIFTLRQRDVALQQAKARVQQVLELLQISHLANEHPHRLSDGQKLRVALAGALVGDPLLLLLDEPSAALDPPGRAHLARHLCTLPAGMLIATHDLPFARICCTHFVLLERGSLALGPLPIANLPDDTDSLWSERSS